MINETLKNYSKEQLIELIEGYCKNWLAMDGVWFQSIERKYGMDEAMEHDCAIWEKFTVIEAKRIKTFLNLPEHPGIEGLKQALKLRLYANINRDEIITEGNTLIYRTTECRVQAAYSTHAAAKTCRCIPAKLLALLNTAVLPKLSTAALPANV